MPARLTPLPLALLAALAASAAAAGDIPEADIQRFVDTRLLAWLGQPLLLETLRRQNIAHAGLDADAIQVLDQRWRAETEATDRPLIDELLARPLSEQLRRYQAEARGLVTEIIVTDAQGLNAAQSDITSDYWQGDEAKWQRTFAVGPEALFVDEVEYDESSLRFQIQISLTVTDPDTRQPIGAITVGLDAEELIN